MEESEEFGKNHGADGGFYKLVKNLDFERTPSAIVRKNQMKDGGADDDQGSK